MEYTIIDECLKVIGHDPTAKHGELKVSDIIAKGKNLSTHVIDEMIDKVRIHTKTKVDDEVVNN